MPHKSENYHWLLISISPLGDVNRYVDLQGFSTGKFGAANISVIALTRTAVLVPA
jgi:hypothetical protein